MSFPRRGVGARRLQDALSLLLSDENFQASLYAIQAVTEQERNARPNAVSTALASELKKWGMHEALERKRHSIRLKHHPCWSTDGDDLRKLLDPAMLLVEDQRINEALPLLEAAAELCRGIFLPEFYPPGEFFQHLHDTRGYWSSLQKQVLHTLIHMHLTMSGPASHQRAFALAQRLPRLSDQTTAMDCLLIADAARKVNQHTLADHYARRAQLARN